MDGIEIGKRLKAARGSLSRKKVCELLDITYSSICMYENGHRIPSDDVKKQMAKLYRKSIQELFFD